MSIYSDQCCELALEIIAGHRTFGRAFNDYVTSQELGELAARERGKFDPCSAKRYGGSQKAWDSKVYRIALDAFKDAVSIAGKPGWWM